MELNQLAVMLEAQLKAMDKALALYNSNDPILKDLRFSISQARLSAYELINNDNGAILPAAPRDLFAGDGIEDILVRQDNLARQLNLNPEDFDADDEEADEFQVPDGLTEAQYLDFLEGQRGMLEEVMGGLINEDGLPATPQEIATNIMDVVGAVPDGNGNMVEVGNVDEATRQMDEMIEQQLTEAREMGLAVPEIGTPERQIQITYTRLDGEVLTDVDVQRIIDHPISDSLRYLGDIQFFGTEEGETPNSRVAIFAVLEDGRVRLQHLALGAVAYQGQHVIAGLGAVQARGHVNFLED